MTRQKHPVLDLPPVKLEVIDLPPFVAGDPPTPSEGKRRISRLSVRDPAYLISSASSTCREARRRIGESILAFCGQQELALALLHSAIQQNYCAVSALNADPLWAKLRGRREFGESRSQANECQKKFLAHRK